MPALPAINVDDTTGSTAILNSDVRRESIAFRIIGDTVWLGFEQSAVANNGIFVNPNELVEVAHNKVQGRLFAVCATGESATIHMEVTKVF